MKVFDLHCDTIGECCNNLRLFENNIHLDLKRCSVFDSYTQVFAVWIPDEYRGKTATDYFDKVSDFYYKELRDNKEIISPYGGNTKIKAILSVEGGSACGGTIEGLHHLYNKGVRIITLAWKNENEICGGAFSNVGFSSFGREFVKECKDLGIVIDASHLNRRSFKELCEMYDGSFIASHSNADIINRDYAHKRNLSDWQIEVIKERGGLIGLNYYVEFIEDENFRGIDALKHQVDYFLKKGCENILSLGSDYDGCKINDELCGVEKLGKVYSEIEKEYGKQITDAIFYMNAENFFNKNKSLNLR